MEKYFKDSRIIQRDSPAQFELVFGNQLDVAVQRAAYAFLCAALTPVSADC